MAEQNPEAALRDLSASLAWALDRLRELEGEVVGQKMALNRCIFALALESAERRILLTEALDALHTEVVGTACSPDTDAIAAGILGKAASAIDEVRSSLSQGPSASLTVIEGGRDDSSSDD